MVARKICTERHLVLESPPPPHELRGQNVGEERGPGENQSFPVFVMF